MLSNAATTTEAHVPGSPIDAVIWEEVSNRTSEDASMSGTYLILMMADGRAQAFGPKDEILKRVLRPTPAPAPVAAPTIRESA